MRRQDNNRKSRCDLREKRRIHRHPPQPRLSRRRDASFRTPMQDIFRARAPTPRHKNGAAHPHGSSFCPVRAVRPQRCRVSAPRAPRSSPKKWRGDCRARKTRTRRAKDPEKVPNRTDFQNKGGGYILQCILYRKAPQRAAPSDSRTLSCGHARQKADRKCEKIRRARRAE